MTDKATMAGELIGEADLESLAEFLVTLEWEGQPDFAHKPPSWRVKWIDRTRRPRSGPYGNSTAKTARPPCTCPRSLAPLREGPRRAW